VCVGEAATTVGTCEACDVDGDCPFGQTCDASKQCRFACSQQGRCFGAVCDTTDNVCVQCLEDDNCGVLQQCDATTRSCVAQQELCAPCGSDDECGAGNLCLRFRLPIGQDRGCGLDCSSGQACPDGSTCQDIAQDGVILGRQCAPDNATVDGMTCQAFRSLEAGTDCRFVGAIVCGQGAACVQDVCTVACTTDVDCPYDSVCITNPAGNNPAKICRAP